MTEQTGLAALIEQPMQTLADTNLISAAQDTLTASDLAVMLRIHPVSPPECSVFRQDPDLDHRPTSDPDPSTSAGAGTNLVTPLSTPGIVDAILAVGSQRQALLNQLRSALISGDDIKTLQIARQLCGLPDRKYDEAGY